MNAKFHWHYISVWSIVYISWFLSSLSRLSYSPEKRAVKHSFLFVWPQCFLVSKHGGFYHLLLI